MNKRIKDIIIAVLAIVVVGGALYYGLGRSSPKINLGPYEALGVATAEETAKLLGNTGQVLALVPDTGAYKNPSVEAELEALRQTLGKHKGMRLVTERIQARPMLMMATGGGVPQEALFKALQSHLNLGALILFFGFPPLPDAELEAVKKFGAKIVVISSLRPGYRRLLERQVVHLVIAPRPEPPPPGPEPKTLRELFDQEFLLITPADAARLP